jgi:sodium/bile acid cotransporter 7
VGAACQLITNLLLAALRVLNLGGSDPVASRQLRQALILTASVKTLPVAVTVLSKLGAVFGDMVGVAVVPCVLAHLGQILVDAMLVTRWQQQQQKAALA